MSSHAAAQLLKQQIPLLDYLVSQEWQPARRIARGRLIGLCPLHADRQPSLLVDPVKGLFYCYGCARGGDVIGFVELCHRVPFGEALAILRRWSGVGPLLSDVVHFYQFQLQRHPEAAAYLTQRGMHQPELVERMRIGYAPGRCLRAHLMGRDRVDVLIGCVDSRAARNVIAQKVMGPRRGVSCWLDLGNHAADGQFVLGQSWNWENKRSATRLRTVAELFPELVDPSLNNDGLPSCSVVEALERELYKRSCVCV